TQGVGEVVRQRLPQPRQPLGLGRAAELFPFRVRFEERLLHHVGRVEFAAQPRVDVKAREQAQVRPEALQRAGVLLGEGVDGAPPRPHGRWADLRDRESSTGVPSQTRTVPSSLAETSRWPSGLKLTPATGPVWPRRVRASWPDAQSQITNSPRWPPATRRLPSGLNVRLLVSRSGSAWTSRPVSASQTLQRGSFQ